MSLNEAFAELKYDKRMKDWNMEQGFVTEKDIQEHLKALRDVNDNVETVTLFQDSQKPVEPKSEAPPVEDVSKQVFEQKPDPIIPAPSSPPPPTPDHQIAHHSFTADTITKQKDETTTNEEANDNPWW